MSAPAAWVERAAAHKSAERAKARDARERFPDAAMIGDIARRYDKGARIVYARNAAGEEYGVLPRNVFDIAACDVLAMLADHEARKPKKDLGTSKKNPKNSGPSVGGLL